MKKNLKETIYELEKSLMTPETRRDAQGIKTLMSEDFFEFCSSGKVYRYKSGDVFDCGQESEYKYEVEDFDIDEIIGGCLLATYKAIRTDREGEKARTLRSSLWRKEKGKWKMIFHQGTPAE